MEGAGGGRKREEITQARDRQIVGLQPYELIFRFVRTEQTNELP